LWRIRRATAIETDLLRIQAEILRERRNASQTYWDGEHPPDNVVYRALRAAIPSGLRRHSGNGSGNGASDLGESDDGIDPSGENGLDPSRWLTHCFLRLTHLDPGTFERLGRYEAALWRQIVQTMFALRTVRYR